jgi:hypothetical protein
MLVLLLGVPCAFGIASILGLINWIIASKLVATRVEVEEFLKKGILGGYIGRLETVVLDAVFGKPE